MTSIGIIGLPAVADLLGRSGIDVVTGGDFRAAAPAIRNRLDQGHDVNVLVLDRGLPGLGSWAERISQRTRLAVVRDDAAAGLDVSAASAVSLPATIDDLLLAIGHEPVDGDLGATVVSSDGAIEDTTDVTDHPGIGEVSPWGGGPDPVTTSTTADGAEDTAGPADPWADPTPTTDLVVAPEPEPGLVPETCMQCGRSIYGHEGTTVWWHREDRQAGCSDSDSVAVPTSGPLPPPSSDLDAVEIIAAPTGSRRRRSGKGQVVFSMSGKGGVGKSSAALVLASQANEVGREAVLVDANRGQGDLNTYLRLIGNDLPNVYDTAVTGDPAAALLSPERINEFRHKFLDDIHFSVALAPASDKQADPSVTTHGTYASVVRHARTIADLVVVDTQIVERHDTGGLVDRFMVPMLLDDAWLLAITDTSPPSVLNLRHRLTALVGSGVDPSRIMVAINRVDDSDKLDEDSMAQLFEGLGEMIGWAEADPVLANDLNFGGTPATSSAMQPIMAGVLSRVLGVDMNVDTASKASGDGNGGLLSWMFSRLAGR